MKPKDKKKQGSFSLTTTEDLRTGEEYGRSLHGVSEWPDCLRIVGRNRPLATMIAAWTPSAPVRPQSTDETDVANHRSISTIAKPQLSVPQNLDDYAQIDLKLAIQVTPFLSEEPTPGTGYSGFTQAQRYHFLHWLDNVDLVAPVAFRQLYLAQLESALFDKVRYQQAAWAELLRLSTVPNWQEEELLWRVLLLGFHLKQDGPALTEWLTTASTLPPVLLGPAVGQLAILGEPLTVTLLSLLLRKWRLVEQLPEPAILQLRLAYLANTLEAEPLRHLLEQLDEVVLTPKPWRTAHRNLRIRIVQPNLQQQLTPLLREIAALAQPIAPEAAHGTSIVADEDEGVAESSGVAPIDENAGGRRRAQTKEPKRPWQLVLEFGDSRSEYFVYALNQAKRRPGYVQIMDENRRMIHRVHFAKSEMRYFWSMWEYVQSWSSTQIYLNGDEVQKWKIYPYSPYLR